MARNDKQERPGAACLTLPSVTESVIRSSNAKLISNQRAAFVSLGCWSLSVTVRLTGRTAVNNKPLNQPSSGVWGLGETPGLFSFYEITRTIWSRTKCWKSDPSLSSQVLLGRPRITAECLLPFSTVAYI